MELIFGDGKYGIGADLGDIENHEGLVGRFSIHTPLDGLSRKVGEIVSNEVETKPIFYAYFKNTESIDVWINKLNFLKKHLLTEKETSK